MNASFETDRRSTLSTVLSPHLSWLKQLLDRLGLVSVIIAVSSGEEPAVVDDCGATEIFPSVQAQAEHLQFLNILALWLSQIIGEIIRVRQN